MNEVEETKPGTASVAPGSDVSAGSDFRHFRWRTIPVGIIGGFGLIYFASGSFIACVYFPYFLVTGEAMYTAGPSKNSSLIVGSLSILIGLWLMFAASQWWYGHWWRAIAMIVVLIVVFQFAVAIGLIPE